VHADRKASRRDALGYGRSLAAFADGPVADHPEPVAAEAGIVVAQPDGDDLDTVRHG
jgi:hypothetical protein